MALVRFSAFACDLVTILAFLGDVEDPTNVIVGSFFLIVLLVLGFMALMRVKKWMAQDDEPDDGIGFTLGDLRRLHQQGRMTDEEFEKARVQMIAATQRAAERAAEAAREAAKKSGGVTDIDELRARAKRNEADRPKPPGHASPAASDAPDGSDALDDGEGEWETLPPEDAPPTS